MPIPPRAHHDTQQPALDMTERIDGLMRLLNDSASGQDVPALSGQLGLAWLELYEDEGHDDALIAGLSWLRAAIDAQPQHDDRAWWSLWIGLGHAERGRRMRSLADYHESIDWISRLYADPGVPEPVRDRTAVVLLDVCWERHWLVQYGPPIDTSAALIEVDRLLARIAPLLTGAPDPIFLRWVRMAVGLACLERFELTDERADLDRGVDLLATASVWDLTAGTPLLCRIGSELANAWRRIGVFDGDLAYLDRAVTAGRRTMERAGPDDGTAWQMLHVYQAHAHEARWQADHNPADRDAAVTCWQVASDRTAESGTAEPGTA